MLSAASIYYARDKHYALALLAAGLSTVTRVPGFINLSFVLGIFLLNEGIRLSRKHLGVGVCALLSLLPIGMYLVYMKRLTGDYWAPFHEQSLHWFRYSSIPFMNYAAYFVKPYFIAPGGWDNGLLSFIMSTALFLVYIAYFVRRWKIMLEDPRQLLFYLYGALLLVIPFSSQPWYLSSVIRYMMVCIPFFIYLTQLTAKKESVLLTYQFLFFAVTAINVIGFFNGYLFMA